MISLATLTNLQQKTDLLLLDIREADELDDLPTLTGSKHVPMGKVFTEAMKSNLPRNKHIIVFCRTGFRAKIVESVLRTQGYTIDGLTNGLQAVPVNSNK